jgi:hypothetical protein
MGSGFILILAPIVSLVFTFIYIMIIYDANINIVFFI